MSQQTVLCQWTEEIRKCMPHLSKPQTKALAAFSVGIAKMVAAVAFEGRSIPVAWRRLPQTRIGRWDWWS